MTVEEIKNNYLAQFNRTASFDYTDEELHCILAAHATILSLSDDDIASDHYCWNLYPVASFGYHIFKNPLGKWEVYLLDEFCAEMLSHACFDDCYDAFLFILLGGGMNNLDDISYNFIHLIRKNIPSKFLREYEENVLVPLNTGKETEKAYRYVNTNFRKLMTKKDD